MIDDGRGTTAIFLGKKDSLVHRSITQSETTKAGDKGFGQLAQ